MNASKWIAKSLAAALFVGGFTVNLRAADSDAPQPAPARARLLQRVREKLDLTDDQVARIKAVVAPEKEALTGLISRLHEARKALRESIQSADATESSVRAASANLASVEADLAVERMKLFGKISPILTQEQRDKLGQLESKLDALADRMIHQGGRRSTDSE